MSVGCHGWTVQVAAFSASQERWHDGESYENVRKLCAGPMNGNWLAAQDLVSGRRKLSLVKWQYK